jgi:hypothetical protein
MSISIYTLPDAPLRSATRGIQNARQAHSVASALLAGEDAAKKRVRVAEGWPPCPQSGEKIPWYDEASLIGEVEK